MNDSKNALHAVDQNDRIKKYHVVLISMMCLATFLEGFDFFIVSLIIDLLGKEFHMTNKAVLAGVSIINIGAICGFFVVRLGDRVGRRPIFVIGIFGFGLMSVMSALSHGFGYFVVYQFITKMFLVTEFNIAIVIVTEEFPSRIRASAVAVLEVAGAIGAGVAMLVSKTVIPALGWRGMYFIGGLPLLLTPFIFILLKETRNFLEEKERGGNRAESLWHIWTTPYRRNVAIAGTLWFLAYLCYAGLIYHWVLFAKTERNWSTEMVGVRMSIAALLGMSGYLAAGVLMDSIGRRFTAIVFFFMSSVTLIMAFTAQGSLLMLSLVLAMFFIFGLLPICSTINAELFPTNLRANASAWCNFLIGRPAQVIAPALVGGIMGYVGGIGNAVCFLAVAPVVAMIVIWKYLPETKGIQMDKIESQLAEATT